MARVAFAAGCMTTRRIGIADAVGDRRAASPTSRLRGGQPSPGPRGRARPRRTLRAGGSRRTLRCQSSLRAPRFTGVNSRRITANSEQAPRGEPAAGDSDSCSRRAGGAEDGGPAAQGPAARRRLAAGAGRGAELRLRGAVGRPSPSRSDNSLAKTRTCLGPGRSRSASGGSRGRAGAAPHIRAGGLAGVRVASAPADKFVRIPSK